MGHFCRAIWGYRRKSCQAPNDHPKLRPIIQYRSMNQFAPQEKATQKKKFSLYTVGELWKHIRSAKKFRFQKIWSSQHHAAGLLAVRHFQLHTGQGFPQSFSELPGLSVFFCPKDPRLTQILCDFLFWASDGFDFFWRRKALFWSPEMFLTFVAEPKEQEESKGNLCSYFVSV